MLLLPTGSNDLLTTDKRRAGRTDEEPQQPNGGTRGALVRGVRVAGARGEAESIVMRSRSGTFRRIVASHPLTKIQSLMKGAR